jgi:hypothetical protein
MEAEHMVVVGMLDCGYMGEVCEDFFFTESCQLVFQTPQIGFAIGKQIV